MQLVKMAAENRRQLIAGVSGYCTRSRQAAAAADDQNNHSRCWSEIIPLWFISQSYPYASAPLPLTAPSPYTATHWHSHITFSIYTRSSRHARALSIRRKLSEIDIYLFYSIHAGTASHRPDTFISEFAGGPPACDLPTTVKRHAYNRFTDDTAWANL